VAAPFLLGWYTADNVSYAAARVKALPVKPQVVNYYSMWEQPFMASFAQAAWADGVTTFIEIEPWHCGTCAEGKTPRMPSIAAGAYDQYLREFGQAIRAFGHPVMITFGHEMNGPWYPWGDGGSERATPAQWVAAWDHVVTVVRGQAPGLTSWVWAPSVEPATRSAAPFWPGDQYVDSVGIDGYLRTDAETYQSVFGATVARFRRMTSRPIWIAETGLYINATTGIRLAAYITAVKAAGLAGLLYFDRHPYVLRGSDQLSLARAMRAELSRLAVVADGRCQVTVWRGAQ
jgi:beta-mannanase